MIICAHYLHFLIYTEMPKKWASHLQIKKKNPWIAFFLTRGVTSFLKHQKVGRLGSASQSNADTCFRNGLPIDWHLATVNSCKRIIRFFTLLILQFRGLVTTKLLLLKKKLVSLRTSYGLTKHGFHNMICYRY